MRDTNNINRQDQIYEAKKLSDNALPIFSVL